MDHPDFSFLNDLVIILGLAAVVSVAFKRFRLPTVIGFLITGIVFGPAGFKLVSASEGVETLAEVGVIFLLFIIGLEFSLKSLSAIRKSVFVGGGLQVGLTVILVAGIFMLMGKVPGNAVFAGFMISLSSTAIVLKLLQEKGEMHAPQGKMALAILIFQDIIVVPMMLFAPILAGQAEEPVKDLLWLLGKVIVLITIVIITARYIFPKILHEVARTRSQEIFILVILVTCFSVAWISAEMGLSLALGAFLAGLIISESEYSHQAIAQAIPFREVFMSVFFISIGMLVDLNFFFGHIHWIILLTLGVFLLKTTLVGMGVWALKFPARIAILTGLSLFQVGEFSFILAKVGLDYNLLDGLTYQYFLAVSILSMGLTPLVLNQREKICALFEKTGLSRRAEARRQDYQNEETDELPEDHVIIIGYGINGKNVSRAARFAKIPYVILELNPDTVKYEKAKGVPIHYGDAVHPHTLENLNIGKARVVVVAISDPAAARQIIVNIRQLSQQVYIIVRTRLVSEIEENLRLGADSVIPEEFETSIEIFSRLLHKYMVPIQEIETFTNIIREDNYDMFRPENHSHHLPDLTIPNFTIASIKAERAKPLFGSEILAKIGLRSKYGLHLLAIKRQDQFHYDISGDTVIQSNDILYVAGKKSDIDVFYHDMKASGGYS
ncbi:MAG: cation:proton antiporter [Cryomorphaceae bacterium]|nr:cation:proton antiporter [Cryomorphaceae bacterium]